MKKLALLSLIIIGLATILSSTCKKDPYNNSNNNNNNNNNNNYDTTATFNVYVQDSSQLSKNIIGATVCVYRNKAELLAAIQAGGVLVQAPYQQASTMAINGDTNAYVTFTVYAPYAPKTKLYYVYAQAYNPNNPNDFRYSVDSIAVSECKPCNYSITVILPKW